MDFTSLVSGVQLCARRKKKTKKDQCLGQYVFDIRLNLGKVDDQHTEL